MSAPLVMALASIAAAAAVAELARRPLPVALWRRRSARPAAPPARWAAPRNADDALLDAAGRRGVPDAGALAERRRQGALLGGCWAAATGWLLGLPPLLIAALAAGGAAAGDRLPLLLLRSAARRRAATLRDEAPELLELLAVACGCGLPMRAALAKAGRWSGGELGVALQRAAAELHGGAPADAVLDRLVREHPVEEIEAATAVLRRATRHGSPAAAPLRALADGARHARARRSVEHAARAAPRIQLVAALLLVPAALCVLGAGVAAGTL